MSSSSLGFSMLAKGMAKRVGDMHISESLDEYTKRAVATTTPMSSVRLAEPCQLSTRTQ